MTSTVELTPSIRLCDKLPLPPPLLTYPPLTRGSRPGDFRQLAPGADVRHHFRMPLSISPCFDALKLYFPLTICSIKYQLPSNSDYQLLTHYVFSEDENEFINNFRHHEYSHKMHSNFTFLWLHFLFSSEKSRFRLPTLRPSSIGLFWVHLQSHAPEKNRKMFIEFCS